MTHFRQSNDSLETNFLVLIKDKEKYSAIPNRRVYTDHVSKGNFPHYMRLLGSYTIEKHRRNFFFWIFRSNTS